jgi:hypothetical protein
MPLRYQKSPVGTSSTFSSVAPKLEKLKLKSFAAASAAASAAALSSANLSSSAFFFKRSPTRSAKHMKQKIGEMSLVNVTMFGLDVYACGL